MATQTMSRYREEILKLLSNEPKSANEIADYLRINQRTAQVELMRLALDMPDVVKYKKIGRTNLFWRVEKSVG